MKNIVLIFATALILSACQTTAPKECTRKDIVLPKELRQPSVQYPPISYDNAEEGTVTLLLAVQTDGSISDIRIARSSGYQRLDTAAQKALRNIKLQPATCHGKPIAVQIHQSFTFELTNDS